MVKVDKEKCIGCGSCASTCSEVFKVEEGKAHVVSGKESAEDECVQKAIDECPVDAISK